ncbi:MAG TPA: hypothetical protein VIK91_10930 [Nannocystis sp.]
MAGVEADLVVAVVLGRGRGQDLADPVGDDVDGVEVVGRGEARATPADDVGPDDVVRREADVDLAYDPPAVGAVVVVVEGAAEVVTHAALDLAVGEGGGRLGEELAAEDLGLDVLREVEQVLVGGVSAGGGHAVRILRVCGAGARRAGRYTPRAERRRWARKTG